MIKVKLNNVCIKKSYNSTFVMGNIKLHNVTQWYRIIAEEFVLYRYFVYYILMCSISGD